MSAQPPIQLALDTFADIRAMARIESQVKGNPKPSKELICEYVAGFYRLTFNDILGRRRPRQIALPRHVAMSLCRKFTNESFEELAPFFQRHHTSVMYAVEMVKNLTETDAKFRVDLQVIEEGITKAVSYVAIGRTIPTLPDSTSGNLIGTCGKLLNYFNEQNPA